jgi:hypothetical protein
MTTVFEIRYLANTNDGKEWTLAKIDYSPFLEKGISIEQAKESSMDAFEKSESNFLAW